MELAEIQTFIKVVQTGSLTKAAVLLGTQKSNVSRSLNNLEKKLHVRLLERNSRALTLTEIGQGVYEKCLQALAALAEAERMAKLEVGKPVGVLKLTCGVEFGMLFVSHWITQYMAQNPAVAVEAHYTGDLVDLVREGFDLAIRLGELNDSSLIANRIGELSYGLFATEAYLKKHGVPKTPQDLVKHNCIIFNAGLKDNWPFVVDKTALKVKVSGRLKVNNVFSVLQAAEQGLGIARLPMGLCADKTPLKPILPQFNVPPVAVYAVFPSAQHLPPKVRVFIDLAKQEFAQAQLKPVRPGRQLKN